MYKIQSLRSERFRRPKCLLLAQAVKQVTGRRRSRPYLRFFLNSYCNKKSSLKPHASTAVNSEWINVDASDEEYLSANQSSALNLQMEHIPSDGLTVHENEIYPLRHDFAFYDWTFSDHDIAHQSLYYRTSSKLGFCTSNCRGRKTKCLFIIKSLDKKRPDKFCLNVDKQLQKYKTIEDLMLIALNEANASYYYKDNSLYCSLKADQPFQQETKGTRLKSRCIKIVSRSSKKIIKYPFHYAHMCRFRRLTPKKIDCMIPDALNNTQPSPKTRGSPKNLRIFWQSLAKKMKSRSHFKQTI